MRGGAITESLIKFIFNQAHPVGSYYWSSDSTNPANLFGGTLEQIKDTFILAAGDTYKAGSTGGESTHTLSGAEIAAHTHSFSATTTSSGSHKHSMGELWSAGTTGGGNAYVMDNNRKVTDRNTETAGSHTHSISGTTGATGSSQPHNNMPPYKVAYCWHRTA